MAPRGQKAKPAKEQSTLHQRSEFNRSGISQAFVWLWMSPVPPVPPPSPRPVPGEQLQPWPEAVGRIRQGLISGAGVRANFSLYPGLLALLLPRQRQYDLLKLFFFISQWFLQCCMRREDKLSHYCPDL